VGISAATLDGRFGARLDGIEAPSLLEPSVVERIRDLYYAHSFVHMSGISDLTQDALIAFARQFGEPFAPPFDLANELVSSFSDTYGSFGSNVELPFHSDLQYLETPPSATILYAVNVPTRGGDTYFADLYRAFAELPPHLTALAADLKCWTVDPTRGEKGALHPLVRCHEVTGKPALFVSAYTLQIDGGVSTARGARLLKLLHLHVDRGSMYYRHQWHAGDLVVFDNRCTNHKRDAFDENSRTLWRVVVRGDRPNGPALFPEET
jgi:taurine dioxygenase